MKYRQTTHERIKQLRLCMLVHSYVYYKLNDSLISDHKWQAGADELVRLQVRTRVVGCYDEAFKDWDASTGYHLPFDDWVQQKAQHLLAKLRQRRPSLRKQLLQPKQRSLLE